VPPRKGRRNIKTPGPHTTPPPMGPAQSTATKLGLNSNSSDCQGRRSSGGNDSHYKRLREQRFRGRRDGQSVDMINIAPLSGLTMVRTLSRLCSEVPVAGWRAAAMLLPAAAAAQGLIQSRTSPAQSIGSSCRWGTTNIDHADVRERNQGAGRRRQRLPVRQLDFRCGGTAAEHRWPAEPGDAEPGAGFRARKT
jgi:hypothetical protein